MQVLLINIFQPDILLGCL